VTFSSASGRPRGGRPPVRDDRKRARPSSLAVAPSVPPDSLAYAFLRAAELVAGVIEGGNLTDAFERMQSANPDWTDATRGAVRDLTWTTLRDYRRGDVVLDRLMHTPPPPPIRGLLLLALLRLKQRPEQAHTVVDQAVQAAAVLMPGLKGMVNGVLRNALRQRALWDVWVAADASAHHAYPEWWIRRVRAAHPEHWEAVLDAGNQRPPMALRVNVRRSVIEDELAALGMAGLNARLLEHGALVLEQPVAVARVPGYAEGRLSVQDAGAQWAAKLLDPAEGDRVLDACAAPGGKTAHLLEHARIDLLALELDPQRALRVERNLGRLGLQAQIKVADCRRLQSWWDGRPFDRILADVPCSASGVVRRHPDIKWLRREEDIAAFAAQQAEILDALWQTLAPGGTMLYVTCSVFDEENAAQIARFCTRHPGAVRLPIDGRPERQLLPNADHDGFYFALLHKPG
jgi:16S rRNA (cytosine967-C5)-methyltransferase